MSPAARALAIVASAASIGLIAGCAPEPEIPPSISQRELEDVIARQNEAWWKGMFPEEPMPEVEVEGYLRVGDTTELIDECVVDAGLPGITLEGGTLNTSNIDVATQDALNHTYFICALTYPTDYSNSDPAEIGWLSAAQVGWLYDYLTKRSAPCLALLGYRISPPPDRQSYIEGYYVNGSWNPYYQSFPFINEEDWTMIDYHCPPPPIGGAYHL